MDFFEAVKTRRSVRKYTSEPVPRVVIEKALAAAQLAPNSSNMQPWEFYWVKSPEKKQKLVEACLNQSAAKTAQELIVFVSRIDTWRRNRQLMLDLISEKEKRGEAVNKGFKDYYQYLIPYVYFSDWFNLAGIVKKTIAHLTGIFKPVPRLPGWRHEIREVATKTTALACENFMLAIAAQGYGTCPMEGFDECRVKKILGLQWACGAHVVMVISVGQIDPEGIWGDQIRHDSKYFVKEI